MKTPTHNPTPGTLHAPCTYASMQSVLVKIASPAQTPAPCDQPTARVRARVDLCLDLLAKVLRSATVRSAILREENRVSHGLPARVVASCTVPAADVRGREEEENRSIGRACAEVCALRAARCTLRSEEQDCLRHGLRAASGALRAAIVPQHMPGLDAASCNLRAAACDWPTARGLRLADCGSRVCSQTKQLCRHHAHMPGIDSASCNLRRAVCDVADGAQSIALGTMMRRATCDVQSARSLGSQVARRRAQDATQRHEVKWSAAYLL